MTPAKPLTADPALATRFWSKVKQDAGCWEWQSARLASGYGVLSVNGQNKRAHRLSWAFTHGPIPPGFDVLHHCDNPACVRPDHLFLGTARENAEDRNRKGRQASGTRSGAYTHPERVARGERSPAYLHPRKGEANPRAKLTAEQVREVRQRTAQGESSRSLARAFGISRSAVQHIRTGRSWPEA